MLLFRNLVLIALVVTVVGCAASVRYAPRVPGILPGYVDQRLGEETYQVRIGEAWPKDWQDLEKFALYRAAEITQEAGKRYFTVLNASSRINSYAIALPKTSTTTGTVNTIGSTSYVQATTNTSGGGVANIQGGWYTLEFKVISDTEVGQHRDVIDSEQIFSDFNYFIDSRR